MKNKSYPIKSKKALSVIIGYVLLIVFSAVIAVIVFQWLKTYVPSEELNCPAGTSILISKYDCSLSSNTLKINITNNGKFDIGGYFIYATNSPTQELATIDLTKNNTDITSMLGSSGIKFGNDITDKNSLKPNDEEMDTYDITGISNIYSITILPIRWQTEKNRNVLVSCKDVKVVKSIECA